MADYSKLLPTGTSVREVDLSSPIDAPTLTAIGNGFSMLALHPGGWKELQHRYTVVKVDDVPPAFITLEALDKEDKKTQLRVEKNSVTVFIGSSMLNPEHYRIIGNVVTLLPTAPKVSKDTMVAITYGCYPKESKMPEPEKPDFVLHLVNLPRLSGSQWIYDPAPADGSVVWDLLTYSDGQRIHLPIGKVQMKVDAMWLDDDQYTLTGNTVVTARSIYTDQSTITFHIWFKKD